MNKELIRKYPPGDRSNSQIYNLLFDTLPADKSFELLTVLIDYSTLLPITIYNRTSNNVLRTKIIKLYELRINKFWKTQVEEYKFSIKRNYNKSISIAKVRSLYSDYICVFIISNEISDFENLIKKMLCSQHFNFFTLNNLSKQIIFNLSTHEIERLISFILKLKEKLNDEYHISSLTSFLYSIIIVSNENYILLKNFSNDIVKDLAKELEIQKSYLNEFLNINYLSKEVKGSALSDGERYTAIHESNSRFFYEIGKKFSYKNSSSVCGVLNVNETGKWSIEISGKLIEIKENHIPEWMKKDKNIHNKVWVEYTQKENNEYININAFIGVYERKFINIFSYAIALEYLTRCYNDEKFQSVDFIEKVNNLSPSLIHIKLLTVYDYPLSLHSEKIQNLLFFKFHNYHQKIYKTNKTIVELKNKTITSFQSKTIRRFIESVNLNRFLEDILYLISYQDFSSRKENLTDLTILIKKIKDTLFKIPSVYTYEKQLPFNIKNIKKNKYIIDEDDYSKNEDQSLTYNFFNIKAEKFYEGYLSNYSENTNYTINKVEFYNLTKRYNTYLGFEKENEQITKWFIYYDLTLSFLYFEYFLLNSMYELAENPIKIFKNLRVKEVSIHNRLNYILLSNRIKKLKSTIDLNKDDVLDLIELYNPKWINIYTNEITESENYDNKFKLIIEAYKKGDILEGLIKSRIKGGMIVEVLGLEVFLPGSQIDVNPIRDYEEYIGKKMEFKVVKINHEFRNVVVSHKALIEADLEEQKKKIMSKLEVGQVLEGTVKNITSYGVFINLGGIDGLVHKKDLSWGRFNHPEEIVELDSRINVVILEFDDDKKRIKLGLKQLAAHPWDALDEKIAIGDKIKGKVVVVADYGAFVEVQTGIEALVHVSEMSWSTHLISASDFLKVGQEIEAQVLTLDREDRKMSLGMKQLQPDPWAKIAEKFPIGSNQKVTVRNFTNFGIFVQLEEGVDGLIHISDLSWEDLSWEKKIKHPSDFTKIGEVIEAQVLELDMEQRKLSLGVKQLEDNPWNGYESTFGEGTEFEAEVISTSKNGATIALAHGVKAFAPGRHLVKEDGYKAVAGEKLKFRVIEFHKEAQKIVVSHTVLHNKEVEAAEKKSADVSVKKIQQTQIKNTFGDIDELVALKESLTNNPEN